MKLFIVMIAFVFQFSMIFPGAPYSKFADLEYGITQEDVIQKCGIPARIDTQYEDVFFYELEDCEIVINFFTDNSLSCIYQKKADGDISIIKEFYHSFFTNSSKRGEFEKSGKESEQFLLSRKFMQKYFYFNQMLTEIKLSKEADTNLKLDSTEYFTKVSDRIIFTYYSLNGEAPHCICAYILSDDPISEREKITCQIGFIKYDKNHDETIDEDEGDWFNNRYVFITDDSIDLDRILE
nr:hypothetical protein [uncultured Treponema sp.]